MKVLIASHEHFNTIKSIVNDTIEAIYPNYYPRGAVDFFLAHHSDEAIQKSIDRGSVYLIQVENLIVGTGTIDGNEINRFFVLPQYQGRGYGTVLMNELERLVFIDYPDVQVDASLSAYQMYVHRGYVPVEYHTLATGKGHYLCYHVVRKTKQFSE